MLLLSLLIASASPPDKAATPEPPVEEEWAKLKGRIESTPQDVAKFIDRRAGCNHFAGEIGSGDQEREREVNQAMEDLRCNDIEVDERSLQRAYLGQEEILDLLEKTRDMYW